MLGHSVNVLPIKLKFLLSVPYNFGGCFSCLSWRIFFIFTKLYSPLSSMSDSINIPSSVIIQKSGSYILPSSNILFIFTSLSFQALSTSFSNVSYESIIIIYVYSCMVNTAWKVSLFRVFVVRIFSYSHWIRKHKEYLSVFSPNAGKCGPEKLLILRLFT